MHIVKLFVTLYINFLLKSDYTQYIPYVFVLKIKVNFAFTPIRLNLQDDMSRIIILGIIYQMQHKKYCMQMINKLGMRLLLKFLQPLDLHD